MPGMSTETGRRERKKAETRAALVDAALVLFAEQGVDATSVEQIADRVDISARTFHRYFASKDELLFADTAERRQQFADALAARPADEPLLTSLREVLAEMCASTATQPEHEALRLAIIDTDDTLRAMSLKVTEDWAALIAEESARRLRLSSDDLLPRLLGGSVIAALRTARRRWQADPSLDLEAEVRRCVDLIADLATAIDQPTTTKTKR
jgi:AcrR family transcriptional regulator